MQDTSQLLALEYVEVTSHLFKRYNVFLGDILDMHSSSEVAH